MNDSERKWEGDEKIVEEEKVSGMVWRNEEEEEETEE